MKYNFFCLLIGSISLMGLGGLSLITAQEILAQVVINEFSPRGEMEWVELYNSSNTEIDLTGWILVDAAQPPKTLTDSMISAGGYFVFESPKGWLNDSGSDSITLKDSSNTPVSSVSYGSGGEVGIPASDKSAGRVPDGSNNWANNLVWTKGYTNPYPTPSPSPTPTPTPTPTPSPTNAPISTNTPTPRPTATPTKIPTKTPTPTKAADQRGNTQDENSGSGGESSVSVLGLREELNREGQSGDEAEQAKSFPVFAAVLVGLGILLVGVSGFVFIRARRKRYNELDEKAL